MSVNKLLLWEKYRPKTMEDVILLPRIREQFKDGVTQHYIFHGHYGTGKTSLARILIGKYSKETPFLELNCSFDTSIDVLRTQIDDFCKFSSIMDTTTSDIKYVFLDEFERVSTNFQDAFKAFIEKYNKNVRFIITTNHINKISDGLKSRIKLIDFDVQGLDEEKFLKQEIYKKITNTILPNEGGEIPKEDLIAIINKKFPDFRAVIVEVQGYLETGTLSSGASNISNKIKLDLYKSLYDNLDYEQIYHFLMSNFGAEKIHSMLTLLGKPFVEWAFNEKREDINKLFQTSYVVTEFTPKLDSAIDPIILGMTVVGKFRDILKNPA